MALSFRTLWLSDIHLGNPAARAGDLLAFLDSVTCEKLYLVGDIVDLERMKSRPSFPESHREAVKRFLEIAFGGTKVTYIPGNHDHELRDLAGRELCGIPVMLECEHVTESGQRLLVTHGDILDREIRKGTNLEQFGAAAYAVLLALDVRINDVRSRLGRDHLSIMSGIKARLASANEYIRRFEEVAASYAKRRDFAGIVCGHIHRPGIRTIGGVCYANDGDWVEHRTALAETQSGELKILRWANGEVQFGPSLVEQPLAA